MIEQHYIVLEISYKSISNFKDDILEIPLSHIATDVVMGSIALFDANRNNILYIEKIAVLHFLMEFEESMYIASKNNNTKTFVVDDYQRFKRIELFCNKNFIYIKNDDIEAPICIKYNLFLQDFEREKKNLYCMLTDIVPNLNKHNEFSLLEKFLLG